VSVVFASSVMSTLDSQLYNFGSLTVKNLMKTDPATDHDKYIRQVRVLTVALLALLSAAAILITDIINYLIDSLLIISVAVPFLFAAVFFEKITKKMNDAVCAGVLATGAVFYIWLFLSGNMQSVIANSWAFLLTTMLLFLAWLVHSIKRLQQD
jgi:hypothetical protein